MSNSFNISVKPEIAAAVVKIDANKTVIDENKVILADLHDTDIPANLTAIGNNLTAIGANNTILADLHDTDLPGAVTKIDDNKTVLDAIQPDEYITVIVSDSLIIPANAEQIAATETYWKAKEILITVDGLYRITFDLKADYAAETAYGKVYKSGVAHGTEQTNITTSYVSYSEDLSFVKGDLVQLYIKTSTSGKSVRARNFRIKGTFTTPSGVVIIDS